MSTVSPLRFSGFTPCFQALLVWETPQDTLNLFDVIAQDIPRWLCHVEEDPSKLLSEFLDFIFERPEEAQSSLENLIRAAKFHFETCKGSEKLSFLAFCDGILRNLCLPPDLKQAAQFFLSTEYEDWSLLNQFEAAQKVQSFFKKFNWFRSYFVSLFAGCFEESEKETVGIFVWETAISRKEEFHRCFSELPRFQSSVSDLREKIIVPLNKAKDLKGPVLNNYPELSKLMNSLNVHLMDPTKVTSLCELFRTAHTLWNS